MADKEYSFENNGIAAVISANLLKVPANQLPYAWKIDHVRQLVEDLKEAIYEEEEQYFLGTLVLVESEDGRRLIADGQQRIATTSIILARIRDYLFSIGENEDAASIGEDFLKKYLRRQKEEEYLLQMNTQDDDFFREKIIDIDWVIEAPKLNENWESSNKRLFQASEVISNQLKSDIANVKADQATKILNTWADYLIGNVKVVAVVVSDEVGAFRMFETLNDRGLRASQADILKNYLFSRVKQTDLEIVQAKWSQIYGSLGDISPDQDEQLLRFIKHYWTLENGLTRDRELAANIKKQIRKPSQALKFISDAHEAVNDYVAIFSPNDTKWKTYKAGTREDIKILADIINIEQIVPLVFAVARHFSTIEAKKAFALFIAWSVRLMLGNSGRAGRLDKQYAGLAQQVGLGKTTTARELRDALSEKVPNDKQFISAAKEAKVSNAVLARYYLASLEKHLNPGAGELEPSEDVSKVNLEHILPKEYHANLGVDRLEHSDLLNRLGNLTIMQAGLNRDSANLAFKDKKPFYEASDIGLTRELSGRSKFDRDEIDDRQMTMAEAAAEVWSLKFS